MSLQVPVLLSIDQNFERAARGESRETGLYYFEFNAGLNMVGGMQFRGGMFVEAKARIYASSSFPHDRGATSDDNRWLGLCGAKYNGSWCFRRAATGGSSRSLNPR
jgi:hypothetical protein